MKINTIPIAVSLLLIASCASAKELFSLKGACTVSGYEPGPQFTVIIACTSGSNSFGLTLAVNFNSAQTFTFSNSSAKLSGSARTYNMQGDYFQVQYSLVDPPNAGQTWNTFVLFGGAYLYDLQYSYTGAISFTLTATNTNNVPSSANMLASAVVGKAPQ